MNNKFKYDMVGSNRVLDRRSEVIFKGELHVELDRNQQL